MTLPIEASRTNAQLAALLPYPAADANKYRRGRLFLVAGSATYPGAACLAAGGAERAGAGYVEVLCAEESVPLVRASSPSLVVAPWQTWGPAARAAAKHPEACVIGCGFDPADNSLAPMVGETMRSFAGPVLVDGGGLALLATPAGRAAAAERAAAGRALVLTPHGGEAARLARGARLRELAAAPETSDEAAAELASLLSAAYGATVVLKGPRTFIADEHGDVEMVDRGSAALAKAGTGDVLAGIIGALLAQGLAPRDAAALGCALHGEAGRAAARDLTDICVRAADVIEHVPAAVRALGAA